MSEPMIEIADLHKSFGSLQVLRGVNLTVEKGESMTVIGGSGSGKSVLIKHIIGLLFPDRGRVIVDGQSMSWAALGELLNSYVGWSFELWLGGDPPRCVRWYGRQRPQ